MEIPGLRFVSDSDPGFSRKRWGKGFSYFDTAGKRIKDEALRERIKALAIPPAWTEVWISPDPEGHLQVTGRDDKSRKQYIYHEQWSAYQQQRKYDRLIAFAEALPLIRKKTRQHLRKKGWPPEKVLALIVQVLDETSIRIGNEQYKRENDSFGLTTMRRKHLELKKNRISFHFRGKSNQSQEVTIDHPRLVRLIKDCSELPGYEVFRYCNGNGGLKKVDSREVNAYIRELTGEDYSSKDFRTWAGTAAAVEFYPIALKTVQADSRRNILSVLLKMVAEKLGNTKSVCRKYYIHPAILRYVERRAIPSVEETGITYSKAMKEELVPFELLAFALLKQSE